MLHRVAKELGWRSVREMVEFYTPKELATWCAVAAIDGWGQQWTMVSRTIAFLHNTLTRFMGRLGLKPDKDEFLTLDYLEPDIRTGREPVKPLTPEQEMARLEAQHRAMVGL